MNAVTAQQWEQTFQRWGARPSQTEQDKCENAVRAVRAAIAASASLSSRSVQVFPQGSYRNRTNVRLESDVDIAVCCYDTFFPDYSFAVGFTATDVATSAASYQFDEFKDDVQRALESRFGRAAVQRGNKAFDIHENTYRLDADVVPCFEHRRYISRNWNGTFNYESGTQFFPETGGSIVNWPQQHYDNGVAKNAACGRRFKAVARILKNLRNAMDDAEIPAARDLASFLLECLAFNVPNHLLTASTYTAAVREVLVYLYGALQTDPPSSEWGEVNEHKYLFRPSQAWTREQALSFALAAWHFVGFP